MKKLAVLLVLVTVVLSLTGCAGKGSVTGVVTDSLSNAPLAGVSVAIGSATAKTGTDGKFTILNVEAKAQTITASLEGYKPYQGTVVVEKNKTATKNFEMVANTVPVPKGSLTGTVTDSSSDAPLAGVSVAIGGKTVETDAEGKYSVSDIEAKSQTITATLAGYQSCQDTVLIVENQTAVKDFEMIALPTETVSGYVSEFQGGAALVGATVTCGPRTAVTDGNGQFSIEAYLGASLTVTKDGYATTKVQNLLAGGLTTKFEIPVRPLFNPNQSKNPPTLTVSGIEAGETVSGSVDITVTMNSSAAPFAIYSYVSTLGRTPRTDATFDSASALVPVNTTKYENGDNYLRILAYDYNGNGALLFVPFVVDNTATATQLPGAIAKYNVASYTFGTEVGYYSKKQDYLRKNNPSSPQLLKGLDGTPIDLNTVPSDTTFYNVVSWTAATDADGYSLYRSFDGENYTWIGNVTTTSYYDYSPQLTPGQKMWYKIQPYNSFGKGTAVIRSVETMPSFKVFLKSPQNEANGVDLNPTFTWETVPSAAFPPGTYICHLLDVWDSTSYLVYETEIEFEDSFALTAMQLSPGYVYSWDIAGSVAIKNAVDATGYWQAMSVSGGYNYWNGQDVGFHGSVNGEFYFTTIVPAE
jgi:hypothetical protein